MVSLMSFSEFTTVLTDDVGLTLPDALDETMPLDNAELDSIQLFALDVVMDELGCDIPPPLRAQILTFGDLYHHYCVRRSQLTR